ncbi:MAG TPA: asparagine synthase (glutamine-hydrolyzing) [Pirellulaceae bacterium]|jgi:asparagine synthase (glutamine-hydrolysing)|nr:asparagine synthase (glutamine-hydrolyzing) [Pirellulaceae bacterium]
MCGLAGIFDYGAQRADALDERVGLAMLEAIVHRGPDDGCLVVDERMLLGHRRLAILDLSPLGAQPMSDPSGRYWLAYVGEVYNYKELRDELQRAGHAFRSTCDTEVVLHACLEWGLDAVQRLNGMFAFALWDRREESLWLVRDGIGIKPLFFRDDGSRLHFGSEIKAILADEHVPREIDLPAIDEFLTFGYVAAPRTGFAGIEQLRPGEWLLAKQGTIVRRQWHRLPYPERPTRWSEQEAAERLAAALDAAVRRQSQSDVPLGALLSGGLDSSAVVRSMRRDASARGRAAHIETFSAGFAEASFDESPYAAQVAKRFGTLHHAERIEPDAASLMEMLVSHAEDPLADNSMIPLFRLARFTRSRVTVALSGDGADELLAGYDTYRASELVAYWQAVPEGVRRRLIGPLVKALPASDAKYGAANVLRRFAAGAEEPGLRAHCSWRRYVPRELREELYSDRLKSAVAGEDPIGRYAAALDDAPEDLSPLGQQLHIDLRFHLPSDMLVKVDRMSMAHSLEVRVPFLDDEVVRTCLAIPSNVLRRGKRGKLPLRRLLSADLDSKIVNRKKAGFLVPLERWMRREWQGALRERLTAEFAEESGLFRGATLRRMLDEQASGCGDWAYPLFALFTLSVWNAIWIDRSRPVQLVRPADAVATRVERLDPWKGGS